MMAFQIEPEPEPDEPIICERCHQTLTEPLKITSDKKEPFCYHCGHTLGHCIQPSVWACEECGEIALHQGGDDRPVCEDCGRSMACFSAQPSRIYGCRINDKDLDLGYDLLINAQDANMELGNDILRDSQI